MALGRPNDPYMSFRYRIEIEGITEGGFSEVTGLQATTQVEDIREGGVNQYVHKLPKETTFENLTLKRGLTSSVQLWNWYKEVMSGRIERKSIGIILLKDRSQEEAYRWTFTEAMPVKWTGPELKADGSTIAFETLEFIHHGFMKE